MFLVNDIFFSTQECLCIANICICNVTTSNAQIKLCVMLWILVVSVLLMIYTNLHGVQRLTVAKKYFCGPLQHITVEMDSFVNL